jgi:hypothetical protein
MYFQQRQGVTDPDVCRDDLEMRSGHYEILITLPPHPPRKDMCNVAPHGRSSSESMVVDPSQDACPETVEVATRNKRDKEYFSCGMLSCWPSASASSRWASVTPTPANGFEENNHDLRLFTRRHRLRRAAVLPDLRPAAARAVLTAERACCPGRAGISEKITRNAQLEGIPP